MKTLYKVYLALAVLFIVPSISKAQINTGQFLYGNNVDWYGANAMIRTSDGGYAIAGTSLNNSLRVYVMFMIKLDASFVIQWTKYVQSPAGSVAYGITQTADGGYALTGGTSLTSGGNNNIYVAKLSGTGTLQWTKIINSANSTNDNDEGYSIVQTLDGGYAICATDNTLSKNNMFIVRLGSGGGLRWIREMTGTFDTYAASVILARNGDIIACGSTTNYGKGGENIYLARFDTLGTLKVTRTIGGRHDEHAYGISHTNDGGYVVCGSSTSFGNDSINGDVYVAKLDSDLNLQWGRAIGGKNSDYGSSVTQTTDGGYVATGITYSFSDTNHGDAYLVKLDSAGNLKWTASAGGVYLDEGNSIVYTNDGGCAIAGMTLPTQFTQYAYVIKVNPSGTICNPNLNGGSISSGGSIDSGGTATTITLTTTSGGSTGNGPTRSTICSVAGIDNLENTGTDIMVYPNPVSDMITVQLTAPVTSAEKIRVTDITGRELMTEKLNGYTSDIFQLNVSQLSKGMYFISVESSTSIQTCKFIKN